MKTLLKIIISIIITTHLFPQHRGLKIVERDKFTGAAEELTLYENTYALVIGIDNYTNLGFNQQLNYAVKDAKAIAKSMRDNFQFNDVITLYNEQATKTNFQKEISNFRKTGKQDGIFIFFAGHGYTESTQDGDLGYIIPHDGSMDEIEMYKNISMDELRNYLMPIGAKHVFVVVDACYSGAMLVTRASHEEPKPDLAYFKEITRGRVRQVLTAGGKNQAVLDGGPGGHSVFTGYFLQYLENASTYITASQLGFKLPKQVYSIARERGHTQVPVFGNLIGEGDFVFISSKAELPPVVSQSRQTSAPEEIDYKRLAREVAAQLGKGEEEKEVKSVKEESIKSQPRKVPVLFDVNRRESWYYYISYSLAHTYHYPDELEDWLEDSEDIYNAIDERKRTAIELIGIYWHLNPKITGGFIFDYSRDHTIFNDVYTALEHPLYGLTMTHTFIGISVLGYFSEFGNGPFYRIDFGGANMDYKTNSYSDTELSELGTGVGFGIGYSWYSEQLQKVRFFVSFNLAVRNIDMSELDVPILEDFESYSKTSINIGGIF